MIKITSNLYLSIVLIILALTTSSCSSSKRVLKVETFTGFPVPSTFFVGGDLSSKFTYGSIASTDTEVLEGVNLSGAGVGAEVVIGWPRLFTGAGADYSKLYQLESTSSSEDKNSSGTLTSVYALAGFYLFKWRWSFKYILSSEYIFDQKTVGNKELELTEPSSSFGASVTFGGGSNKALSFEFNTITYDSYLLGSESKDFKESAKPTVKTYGIVYAIRF